ncbi:unnamed protein product [Orchesella dallaii]|uniref:Gustatory receptor n=1 Tax=Orchesella dallaii TaxID=48710 RepID=A0ABP1RGY8_9HEXA
MNKKVQETANTMVAICIQVLELNRAGKRSSALKNNSNEMLTPLQKLALKIVTREFFFLPPLPIRWNRNYTKLVKTKNKISFSKISLAFTSLLILLIVLGMNYVVFSHWMIKTRPQFNIGMTTIYIVGFITVGSALVLILIVFMNQDALLAVNNMLQFKHGLFGRLRESKKEWMFDIMLNFVAFYGMPASAGIYFGSLYLNFDPYYFILEDLFGKSEDLRWPLFGFRAVVTLAAFETARLILTYPSVVILDIHILQQCVSLLCSPSCRASFTHLMIEYRRMIVVYRKVKPLIDCVLTFGVTSMFWALICTSWLVIKGFGKIPLVMYVLMLFFVIGLIICGAIMLIIISRLVAGSVQVVEKCRWEARLTSVMIWSKKGRLEAHALRLEADALHPIRIFYKPFLLIDKEFVRRSVNGVMGRICDAVLIF